MSDQICPMCNGEKIIITEINEDTGDVLAKKECDVCNEIGMVSR